MSALPALRRVWWLGLAWAALALVTSATTFLSWVVMPHGGLEVYTSIPYWWADMARPAAALLILIACCVWRKPGIARHSRIAAALAGIAALLALPPLVVLWNNPVLTGSAPPPARILLAQALSCIEFAAVPLVLLWAAIVPARFTPARLAALAALALALSAANDSQSIISLHDSLHFKTRAFWDALLSPAWLFGVVLVVAVEAAAALAFVYSAYRFRRGRNAPTAVAGSWLLIGLAILLEVTVYGLWWEAWELSIPLHILRHADSIAYMLLVFCIGLAFVLPIRNLEKPQHPAVPT